MIPKAQILQFAGTYELQATTVQKDYVLGWILRAFSSHPELSKWVFKGGTCLKKCFFETSRFSEDLDFTIPKSILISKELIQDFLSEMCSEIESLTGITFPRKDWKIDKYENKRGNTSFLVRIPFDGPLKLPSRSLQRIKFDLTQDELLADDSVLRDLHQVYSDKLDPVPKIRCYSINEILAEKTRALVERFGRARDVYDVVNISRNFRIEISPGRAAEIAQAKFEFKELEKPSVQYILESIDLDLLRTNWENQLAHQINELPQADSFIADLHNAIAWWLEPKLADKELPAMPLATGQPVRRQMFPEIQPGQSFSTMDKIRRAARNRFLVHIVYKGSERIVEAYSLRYPATGNEILHAWEVMKNGFPSNRQKTFITNRITYLSTSKQSFSPKWRVEL